MRERSTFQPAHSTAPPRRNDSGRRGEERRGEARRGEERRGQRRSVEVEVEGLGQWDGVAEAVAVQVNNVRAPTL
jgi:hypothetical protein